MRRLAIVSLLFAGAARADLKVPADGSGSVDLCAQLFREQGPKLTRLGTPIVQLLDGGVSLSIVRQESVRWFVRVAERGTPRALFGGEARSADGALFFERARWALDRCLYAR